MGRQVSRFEQLRNKRGIFVVSRMMFELELELVEQLLQRVIPYSIANDHFNYDGVRYYAFSEEFDEVEAQFEAPFYEIEIEKLGDQTALRFIRRTE